MHYKFLFLYLLIQASVCKVVTVISVVDKGVLPLVMNSVGMKLFIDIENKNRNVSCKVYSRVKKCCLTDLAEEDCSIIDIIDETVGELKSRDRKTLVYVIPTICPYDLVGYCDAVLDYRCLNKRDALQVNIPFETTLIKGVKTDPSLKLYLKSVNRYICDTKDQNSLENCCPIDCDIKYAGQRSFFDESIKRCITTPICVGDVNKELPDVVYVPTNNVCKNLERPLTSQDIYAITTGLGTVKQKTKKKADVMVELKSNCSTISQNLYLLKDLMYGKLCPNYKYDDTNFEEACKSAVLAIVFIILSICAVLLSCVLCVNRTMWVHKQWSDGNIKTFVTGMRNKFKWIDNKDRLLRRRSRVDSKTKNALLREVIVRDIPLELWDSIEAICDRMEKKISNKRRYRSNAIGSQISLQKENAKLAETHSTETLCSEKDAILK